MVQMIKACVGLSFLLQKEHRLWIDVQSQSRGFWIMGTLWRDLGHNCVASEHLLLAIIKDGEGVACRALENLGVDLKALRDLTLHKISETGKGTDL